MVKQSRQRTKMSTHANHFALNSKPESVVEAVANCLLSALYCVGSSRPQRILLSYVSTNSDRNAQSVLQRPPLVGQTERFSRYSLVVKAIRRRRISIIRSYLALHYTSENVLSQTNHQRGLGSFDLIGGKVKRCLQ